LATEAFGIDIGGSGAKGAIVDVSTGELISERFKVPTPDPATPDNLAASVVEILDHHGWDGPFGCGLPSVIVNGVVRTAAHIDDSWIGTNAVNLFTETTGHPAYVLNDTDAAGVAEVQLGAGKGVGGTIILLTFGSGIGSAMFRDGILIPNSELGHLELNGREAEERGAARAMERLGLTMGEWLDEVNAFLAHVEWILSPDLLIFGGGISKQADDFLPRLKSRAPLVATTFRNNAGIVGAALAGHQALAAS